MRQAKWRQARQWWACRMLGHNTKHLNARLKRDAGLDPGPRRLHHSTGFSEALDDLFLNRE